MSLAYSPRICCAPHIAESNAGFPGPLAEPRLSTNKYVARQITWLLDNLSPSSLKELNQISGEKPDAFKKEHVRKLAAGLTQPSLAEGCSDVLTALLTFPKKASVTRLAQNAIICGLGTNHFRVCSARKQLSIQR